MNSAYAVGATFDIENLASPKISKLLAQIERLVVGIDGAKTSFNELISPGVLKKINSVGLALDKLTPTAEKAATGMAGAMGRVDKTFAGIDFTVDKMSLGIVEAMARAEAGVSKSAAGMKGTLDGIFTGLDVEMTSSTNIIVADFGRIVLGAENSVRAVKLLREEMRLLGTTSSLLGASGVGGGHPRPGHAATAHGSFHVRAPSTHLPGVGHVSASGDGMAPLIGGAVLAELVKTGVEHAFDMSHWESQFAAAGFNSTQIEGAKAAAWSNSRMNPNASATDGLKNILELNKATGNLRESEGLLGAFSVAETAMQSIKAENLHSKFNGGSQILNFAKGIEEMGITQRGTTEEERANNVKHYANEFLRTMISSRGMFDGNALFALTNNSGGAAQNWDERMGTVVAPIMGDIMKHSKLGNADYMALKSYVGGGITTKATVGLLKYGLAEASDTYTDSKGIHLSANAPWSDGASENLLDWSGKLLERMEKHGVNIHDQKEVNKVVNEIGSNKSTTMMMRALLEPGTRAQIFKEIGLRDNVPDDAASILQNRDPVLKMDALHKKLDDFFTALGGPLVDPAIAGLTKLTAGINVLAQAMQAHPDLTKYGAEGAGVAGLGLLAYGGGKMLGMWGGGDSGLGAAASQLDGSALALKEAAAALAGRHGLPGGGGNNGGPGGGSGGPGFGSVLMLGLGLGGLALSAPGLDPEGDKRRETNAHAFDVIGNPMDAVTDRLFGKGRKAGDVISDWWHGNARLSAPNTDGNTLHRWEEMPAGFKKTSDAANGVGVRLGSLADRTGLVLTSFDGLRSGGGALDGKFGDLGIGAGGLDNAFRIVEATAIGAARAMAALAMSGGVGMGGAVGGLLNASWGGSGTRNSRYGFSGHSPWLNLSGGDATGEHADFIRTIAAKYGIDPRAAVAVAASEGLHASWAGGDHGTSFGDFQMHFGGSGIPGQNSGGLGDVFNRDTGLDARNPANWKAVDEWALKYASKHGWDDWHGAAAKGLHGMMGIGGNPLGGANLTGGDFHGLGGTGAVADAMAAGLDPMLSAMIDRASVIMGTHLGIVSGRRSEAENRNTGGAEHSLHLKGWAADLTAAGHPKWDGAFWARVNHAMDQVSQEMGQPHRWGGTFGGRYARDNNHFDLTQGGPSGHFPESVTRPPVSAYTPERVRPQSETPGGGGHGGATEARYSHGEMTAMIDVLHAAIQRPVHVNLDGKTVGKSAARYMAQNGRFPTSMGGPDHGHHYSNDGGTPVTDSA